MQPWMLLALVPVVWYEWWWWTTGRKLHRQSKLDVKRLRRVKYVPEDWEKE